jgi:hypothetical protein
MIACTFLVAFREWCISRGYFVNGTVLLIDGPLDGERISRFIARGRLECQGGEYLHVAGGDAMTLYWTAYPVATEEK